MAGGYVDQVWIGNYGRYNEGDLVGAWLELPFEPDRLDSFLKDRCGVDATHEEYGIFDTDLGGPMGELGIDVGEFADLEDLNILAEIATRASDRDIISVKTYMDQRGTTVDAPLEYANALLQADDIPFFEWTDGGEGYSSPEERYAYQYIEEVYGDISQLPSDTLAEHFDFEGYGRDLTFEGFAIGKEGFIDLGGCEVRDVYDADDLHELAEESFSDEPSYEEAASGLHEALDISKDALELDDPQVVIDTFRLVEDLGPSEIDKIETYGRHSISASAGALEFAQAIMQAEDIMYFEFDDQVYARSDEERMGIQVARHYGLDRSDLERHFDYEDYGREISADLTLTDEGILGTESIDLDYFTKEALMEEAGLAIEEEQDIDSVMDAAYMAADAIGRSAPVRDGTLER